MRIHFLTAFLVFCPAAMPANFSTIYNFRGNPVDGGLPQANVTVGPGGVLYGTTSEGGSCGVGFGCGTVFSLTPPALPGGAWTETIIHSFDSPNGDGKYPTAGVTLGDDGVLYGTTYHGGGTGFGTGSVYSLTPSDSGAWNEHLLFAFRGRTGANPVGGLVVAHARNGSPTLFGNTLNGGLNTACGATGCGTLFSVTPGSGSLESPWQEVVVHKFAGGGDGASPLAGLVRGKGGVLYGVTYYGGTSGLGAVFSLTPPARGSDGSWTETVLYSFTRGGDGSYPEGTLAIGPGGVLYGTTSMGGTANGGTIFSLTPPALPGGSWTEAVLYNFPGGAMAGLVRAGLAVGCDTNGALVLYGVTTLAGASGLGSIFSLTPPTSVGGPWNQTLLHSFTGADGSYPAGVVLGPDGVLYGTAEQGGTSGLGTVFALQP